MILQCEGTKSETGIFKGEEVIVLFVEVANESALLNRECRCG